MPLSVVKDVRYADQFDPHVKASFLRAAEIASWLPGWAKKQERDPGELLAEADAADWLMFAEQAASAAGKPIPSDSKPYYPSLITRTLVREVLRLTGAIR